MQVDLKTTISAYVAAAPSILNNYYTKDQVYNKDEIDNLLKDFVRVVVDGDPAVIYGRQNGQWVPIVKVPAKMNEILIFGFSGCETMTSEELIRLPGRQGLLEGIEEYLIESTPSKNGYLWFCCPKQITEIVANNGLAYQQCVVNQPGVVKLEIGGEVKDFICYRTNKLAALPGVAYKYRVRVQ